jgi:hypothetical protein
MSHTPRSVIKFWVHTALVTASALLGALTSANAQSTAASLAVAPAQTPSPDAVAFATSGSMRGSIPSLGGNPEPKHLIARRALASVATRLEKFTAPPADPATPPRSLAFGLYVFNIDKAAAVLPLAPFNATKLRNWIDSEGSPRDNTPLGLTMQLAGQALLASPAPHKHLLVLTDGANSSGIEPEDALDLLQRESEKKQTPLFVHVIALGIKPSVFAALKKRGATLIGASDEKQLQTQLDFILENQILLEAP